MLCQDCKKKSTCTKPCEELTKDLKGQEVYLREMLVDLKTLEWLARDIYHGKWHMRHQKYRPLLKKIIHSLPIHDRSMLIMRFRDGMLYREIGKAFGFSKKATSRKFKKILAAIKEQIERN